MILLACLKRKRKKKDRLFLKLDHLDYLSKILLCNECVLNADNSVTV